MCPPEGTKTSGRVKIQPISSRFAGWPGNGRDAYYGILSGESGMTGKGLVNDRIGFWPADGGGLPPLRSALSGNMAVDVCISYRST